MARLIRTSDRLDHALFVGVDAAMGFAEIARIAQAGRKFDRFIDLLLMQKFL